MKTDKGNLWTYPADFRVITTNGIVKKDGKLVMGAGIALEAKKRYKNIDCYLGYMVDHYGNDTYLYYDTISFPTKSDWKKMSSLALIQTSIHNMLNLLNHYPKDIIVVLPPVGCGHGGLNFETQVKPLLEKYFDDRFIVLL